MSILKIVSAHVVVQLDDGPLLLCVVNTDGQTEIVCSNREDIELPNSVKDELLNRVLNALEGVHESVFDTDTPKAS